MATVDQLLQRHHQMESELLRYKETLSKMEKQWKNAVDAINHNKL